MSTTSLETRSPSPSQNCHERRERRWMLAARICHRTCRGGLQGARRPHKPQQHQTGPRPARAASTPSAYNEPATNATATVPTPNEEPWCSKPNKSKPNLWGRPRPTVSDEPMTGAAKPRDSKNLGTHRKHVVASGPPSGKRKQPRTNPSTRLCLAPPVSNSDRRCLSLTDSKQRHLKKPR